MKPIAIFRHAATEGPGFFADFLNARNIPWQLIRIDEGDTLPQSAESYGGLVFMGGPMSVNDDLPWIPQVLALIREAMSKEIPVLGHCLGGQLMAKAMGGTVSRNPVKEIGWGELTVGRNDEARHWFGPLERFMGFHWHGETFSIPDGAAAILSSSYCDNQAFTVGKHLAFQCHIEMTADMVNIWCDVGADEVAASASSPGVQPVSEITDKLDTRIPALNQMASSVYEVWLRGVAA
ncbi:glutamine amidotransferase [Methylobacillus sp. MM3]|uniref:type 1 glutamine amidotransferase n=1 Tax=Methylobacillus sp. MM3 TaxID=1848039 RepID=UPI0007DEFEF7|nr:type 1 glutamine amidotransferase [Methylobacillus sp. MM3]OAJ71358.1 glutamine amidotransferase [Methylobacillus sp. MM3]